VRNGTETVRNGNIHLYRCAPEQPATAQRPRNSLIVAHLPGNKVRNTPGDVSFKCAMVPISVSDAATGLVRARGPYNIDERSIQFPKESRLFDA
jgi:hypothetical protein